MVDGSMSNSDQPSLGIGSSGVAALGELFFAISGLSDSHRVDLAATSVALL
jgi:hypothetical protein